MSDSVSIVPLKGVVMRDSLTYEEVSFEIIDYHVRRLSNNEVTIEKVIVEESNSRYIYLEEEEVVMAKYPLLFSSDSVSR